jgi:nitroreductase
MTVDAYQAIISKRDTRNFTGEPVSDESLRRVLQAGRMAGSAKNRQPVSFVVLRDQSRKAELAKCGDFAAWVPEAAVAIAVVMPEGERELDAGRAAQNLMVAANAEGLASCPATMHHADCAAKALGLPDGHRVHIVVGIGHGPTAHEQKRPDAARKAFEDYVHYDRW